MIFDVNFGLFLLIFTPPGIMKVSFFSGFTTLINPAERVLIDNTSFRFFKACKKQKSLKNPQKIVF